MKLAVCDTPHGIEVHTPGCAEILLNSAPVYSSFMGFEAFCSLDTPDSSVESIVRSWWANEPLEPETHMDFDDPDTMADLVQSTVRGYCIDGGSCP